SQPLRVKMTDSKVHVLACVAAVLLACSCGSSDPSSSAGPSGARQQDVLHVNANGLASPYNMRLEAHLDLGVLRAASLSHQGPEPVAPAAPSAAGCWGYRAPDGRRFALV